ncbi:MAG TPA: hypothetical protein VF000_13505, partial [Agromyces sp.]
MNRFADDEPMPHAASASGGVRAALVVVNAVLILEAVALAAVAVWLVVDLVALRPSSYATAIALTVLVAIGAAWVGATAIASL